MKKKMNDFYLSRHLVRVEKISLGDHPVPKIFMHYAATQNWLHSK